MNESTPAPEHKVNEAYNVWYFEEVQPSYAPGPVRTHYYILECGLRLHVYEGYHAGLKEKQITAWISNQRTVVWEQNPPSLSLTHEGRKRQRFYSSVEEGKDAVVLEARNVIARQLRKLPGGLTMAMMYQAMSRVAEDIVKTGGEHLIFETENLAIRKTGYIASAHGDPDLPPNDYLVRIKTPPDTLASRVGREIVGEPVHNESAGKDFYTSITTDEFLELCRALWRPVDPNVHKTPPKTPESF